MAFKVRNTADELIYALVEAHNQRQVDALSTSFHLSRTERTNHPDYRNQSVTRVTVTAAAATDTATSVTLVNDVKSVVNEHFADATAHNTAVSAAIATATATDLATGVTLGNAIKAAYNTHLAEANVHFTNDGTNTIAAANATDGATLITLLTELKTDVNAHGAGAVAGTYIDIIPA